ncbi:AAA family ATPase [Jannaschia sp. CCS1]|uniref:AAA family ATPase n=1 Tax=Jannaschia sp. (strain CCS1) TaxID=290400 RepID=UPI000A0357EB|nr:AAA family ATPase [Jannaschia sp. CCS1]
MCAEKKVPRLLILTCGAPGVGKSTLLRELDLWHLVVSPDMIRAQIGGIYVVDGVEERGFFEEDEVWREVELEVAGRMKRSEPVIIDATFQLPEHFKMPAKLANEHNYGVAVLDFRWVPKQVAIKQNSMRSGWQLVPERVIDMAYKRYAKLKLGKIRTIKSSDFEESELYRSLRQS